MQSGKKQKALVLLSENIGDFIRYWGFRRIHGQIWTVLYLSKKAKSPTELSEFLGVSKTLISSALQELVDYKLIKELPVKNNKKAKRFQACDDVISVIQKILKTRELKMISNAQKKMQNFKKLISNKDEDFDLAKLQDLELWTEMAQKNLELLTQFSELQAVFADF